MRCCRQRLMLVHVLGDHWARSQQSTTAASLQVQYFCDVTLWCRYAKSYDDGQAAAAVSCRPPTLSVGVRSTTEVCCDLFTPSCIDSQWVSVFKLGISARLAACSSTSPLRPMNLSLFQHLTSHCGMQTCALPAQCHPVALRGVANDWTDVFLRIYS